MLYPNPKWVLLPLNLNVRDQQMYPPLTVNDIIKQGQDMTTQDANAVQVGGDHYKTEIQPWDFIIENDLGYLEGNIIKYVSRYKKKGGMADLLKAQHYLQKLIETVGK
jgi:hypothetical protein